jgi:hypothetical protein
MSAVEYRRWDADDRVSAQWHAVLTAARRDVAFLVTDGHRTMAEQAERYATYQRYGRPLAARPSPTAPHIRAGRHDHAIDVNALDGGVGRLMAWLRRHGVNATRPVAGEDWHLEADPAGLARLAREVSDPLWGYPASERQWIRAYDRLRALERDGGDSADMQRRLERLRARMTSRRRAIRRVAEQSGWDQLRRRDRYRSLEARTR